jgi:hypothetical protein
MGWIEALKKKKQRGRRWTTRREELINQVDALEGDLLPKRRKERKTKIGSSTT